MRYLFLKIGYIYSYKLASIKSFFAKGAKGFNFLTAL